MLLTGSESTSGLNVVKRNCEFRETSGADHGHNNPSRNRLVSSRSRRRLLRSRALVLNTGNCADEYLGRLHGGSEDSSLDFAGIE